MADNSRVDPEGFDPNSRLRASDADRDSAASVINSALAEGRLSADEHSDRLDAIYSAKTHAEIAPLLDDLPSHSTAAVPATTVPATTSTGQVAARSHRGWIVAVLSGANRKGIWHADPVINVLTVLGGAELDFREAVLPGKEISLRAVSLLGGVTVIVPPEMRVVDSGVAVLGGREMAGESGESLRPDAPVLHITGACVLGGLDVKRKERKQVRGKNWPRRIGP
jgi:hypothetical protein